MACPSRHLRLGYQSLCMLALIAVGGCSQMPEGSSAYHDPVRSALTDSAPRNVGVAMALARLPEEAGPVISVTQALPSGIEQQRIALAGDTTTRGENMILVRLEPGRAGPGPTAADIQREMALILPDRAMRLSNRLPLNTYGPFGVASDGRGCAYMWQDVHLDAGAQGLFQRKRSGLAAIRVRLCRAGMTEAVAADLMQRLQLAVPGVPSAGVFGGSPGAGVALAPGLARVDALLDVPGDAGRAAAQQPKRRHSAAPPDSSGAADARSREAATTRVPLPGSADGHGVTIPLPGEAEHSRSPVAPIVPLPPSTLPANPAPPAATNPARQHATVIPLP